MNATMQTYAIRRWKHAKNNKVRKENYTKDQRHNPTKGYAKLKYRNT